MRPSFPCMDITKQITEIKEITGEESSQACPQAIENLLISIEVSTDLFRVDYCNGLCKQYNRGLINKESLK